MEQLKLILLKLGGTCFIEGQNGYNYENENGTFKEQRKGENREGYKFIQVHPCLGKIKECPQQATNR